MQSTSPVSQDDFHGYTLAYEREEIQFPVYVVAFVGACFAVAGAVTDNMILIALAIAAFGFAFYNYPLLETGRPRLGAGQYGVFAEGLGIISWRSIKDIALQRVDMRGSMSNEMRITLQEPLSRALLADWRKRPFYRFLMRLPWSMTGKDVIRIPLDVFDKPADEIHQTFTRMINFYRH
jgi:hypothetical protein